jgi:hypothetical protein
MTEKFASFLSIASNGVFILSFYSQLNQLASFFDDLIFKQSGELIQAFIC